MERTKTFLLLLGAENKGLKGEFWGNWGSEWSSKIGQGHSSIRNQDEEFTMKNSCHTAILLFQVS